MEENGPLPSQTEYITHHISPAPTKDLCGICFDEYEPELRKLVSLNPCKHIFCRKCILSWFGGVRPERGTCPGCRKTLFKADPLTAKQIEEREIDESRDAHLQVNWEIYMVKSFAREEVELENYRVSLPGQHEQDWIHVCKKATRRFLQLESSTNVVRQSLRPHLHKIVLLLCGVRIGHIVKSFSTTVNSKPFAVYWRWLWKMYHGLGDEVIADLFRDGLEHRVFESDRTQVVSSPWLSYWDDIITKSRRFDEQYEADILRIPQGSSPSTYRPKRWSSIRWRSKSGLRRFILPWVLRIQNIIP
ncbi:hypothetical protein B0J11DRAFT_582423 [Dendryphion nanum]|uniref:RING-type domain-containing protein n=1 Tax=Dendryphion nanum TaxID=256645 RepID=A0A9P9IFH5_9PLEO|nr:hypothetical protein B0J11DRAFT_582423 [Dendryphion nanum]